MRPVRLSLDTTKLSQPEGSYPYGKNGVRNAVLDIDENENGFLPSNINLPYKFIGFIETDTYPVYFSTDNVHSAFGFHNTDTDTYEPILDDSILSFKFGFSTNRPIKGEYRRNFRNEIELIWLELGAGANPPRFANTSRLGTDLNDFLLFPKSQIPYITTTVQAGGNLGMGAYYFALKYGRADGTETKYTTLTSPVIAASDNYDTIPGGNTGKSISINITGLDLTYEKIGLVVVERINGVDTPYELPELNIAPAITFVYTGAEKGTQLTLEEVIVPAAYYENAQAITQLTDQLYLGNMTEENIIDWQQYALLAKVRWKSTLVRAGQRPSPAVDSGELRGFMHEDVYAFYIVLKLKNGRNSRAFILPGPQSQGGDTAVSTVAAAQGVTALVYQAEDTCRNLSGTSGDCGVWINQDETYPDIPQFDASAIGGENLRGQPVRHHRMPSIRFCKQNLYMSEQDYGREELDVLGLEVSNVIIPANLQDQVIGWELHYAKRDFNNALVQGQSLVMFGAQANQDIHGSGGNVTSTGGNWGSYQRTHSAGSSSDPESLQLNWNYFRFHAFDLLFNRPSISPTHLSLQLTMSIKYTTDVIDTSDANVVMISLDYNNGANNVISPMVPYTPMLRVSNGQYLPPGTTSGDFSNIRLEEAWVGKLPARTSDPALSWQWCRRDYDRGHNTFFNNEWTYLANLMVIRQNVYLSYYSQTLVRTGVMFSSTVQASSGTIYGGDCFLNKYSFATYGLVTRKDVTSNTGIQDWKTTNTDGIKVFHMFLCESVANGGCRYQTPGNAYSEFWPKSSLSGGSATFFYGFDRTIDPNQIGYSRDCNAVGDLLNGILIASPYDQFVQQSPNKIVRSYKQVSESVINSWKNFAALDYYEAVKNKGPIINLCGMNDRLIIHHQHGIFITRSKATFQGGTTEVVLGTGDIFQFEPNEVRPAKLGYGGTSNPFACLLSPIGYIFPDNQTGELFLFDGTNLSNIGTGLINFLLKYLTVKELNSYIGNGITIGYEQAYKRILLTVKNVSVQQGAYTYVPNFQATPEFFATLVANQSVVYKDGRYQLFKGINTSIYRCDAAAYPALGNYAFTSNEHVANGTVIGTVAATGGRTPYTYIITNTDSAGLGIDPLTGQIKVIDTLAFDYTRSGIVLNIRVTDANGNTATGHATITINHVDSIPVLPAYSVTIPEHSANGTHVNTEIATDRDGKVCTYSIIAGNADNAFAINNATGEVTVNNGSLLDYFTASTRILTVRATYSTGHVDNTLTVNLSFVHEAPSIANITFNVLVGTANGTMVATGTPATQRAGQTGELVYELVSDSAHAGAFQVILDSTSADFLKVKVLDTTRIATAYNDYVITCKVYDPAYPADSTNFTVTGHAYTPYQNVRASGVFRKNDCGTGYTGTDVEYVVPAGTYSSTISQADADAQAAADIAANGQTYANAHGACLVNSTVSTLLIDYLYDTTADLCAYVKTPGLTETGFIVTGTAENTAGPLQYPNDGRDPSQAWLLSSDKLSTGSPAWRFGINIAYFVQKYTGILTTIDFEIRGRSGLSGLQNLSYALRDVTEGHLILSGPTGSKIPSVSSGTSSPVAVSSNITGGANGTVGNTVGSPLLTLTYHFSTNTITVTTY